VHILINLLYILFYFFCYINILINKFLNFIKVRATYFFFTKKRKKEKKKKKKVIIILSEGGMEREAPDSLFSCFERGCAVVSCWRGRLHVSLSRWWWLLA
jgi:hypothetical protein